jgi:hypothetical protein
MSKVLYWECNQKSFDRLKGKCAPGAGSLFPVTLTGVDIRINGSKPDGYFPVYDVEPRFWWAFSCCPFENREMAGGCLTCGDPCL